MSKITRHEVGILNRDELLERIYQREAEFAELVEAAVQLYSWWDRDYDNIRPPEAMAFIEAVKPFLPPPSPADRLDAMRPRICQEGSKVDHDICAIIAELREGES